ncbi:MAG: phosphatidate cytidylyltransferase [Myxococcota bacterium]
MLRTRIATAVVGIPLVLFLIAYGRLPYKLLLVAAGFVAIIEMMLMFFQRVEERLFAAISASSAMSLLVILIFGDMPQYSLYLFTASFLLVAATSIYTAESPDDAYSRMGRGMIMIYFVPILIWFIALTRDIDSVESYKGWEATLLLFGVTWLSDTGGYFIGRAFGRTPLSPRLSPKKTVEGLLGGVVFSVVFAVGFSLVAYHALNWFAALLLGALATLWGQTGDLVESLFKRVAKVKDSGRIIPGHGGMLDRIDALLFNAPLVYLWLKLFAG